MKNKIPSHFGWVIVGFSFVTLALAFVAWFAGFLYGQVGSYLPVFIMMIVGAFFSCLSIWWAAPRKIRMVPGERMKIQRGIKPSPK